MKCQILFSRKNKKNISKCLLNFDVCPTMGGVGDLDFIFKVTGGLRLLENGA